MRGARRPAAQCTDIRGLHQRRDRPASEQTKATRRLGVAAERRSAKRISTTPSIHVTPARKKNKKQRTDRLRKIALLTHNSPKFSEWNLA